MYRNALSLVLMVGVGTALLAGCLAAARGMNLYLLIVISIFYCFGFGAHFFSLRHSPKVEESPRYIAIMAVTVGAAVSTWGLRAILGFNVAVASGLVGLLATMLLPSQLAAAAYAASVTAMSSMAVLTGLPMFICAGFIVGGFFSLALPVYEGIGGKLGTIAAGAVFTTVLIFSLLGVI
jgi:hypothetical protein